MFDMDLVFIDQLVEGEAKRRDIADDVGRSFLEGDEYAWLAERTGAVY